MNIELDQHYRTRSGDRVRCICVDGGHPTHPVIVLSPDGIAAGRTPRGRAHPGDAIEHERDIVDVWRDEPPEWPDDMPVWAHWLTCDVDGQQSWWSEAQTGRPTCYDGSWFRPPIAIADVAGYSGRVPPSYAPDWPDSIPSEDRIIERPGEES